MVRPGLSGADGSGLGRLFVLNVEDGGRCRGISRGVGGGACALSVCDCPSIVPSVVCAGNARKPPNMRLPRLEKDRVVRKSSSRRLSVGMDTEMGEK